MAQIRGHHGLRLFGYFLAEPVTVLVIATGLGVLTGRWVSRAAAQNWLTTGDDVAALQVGTLGWVVVAVAASASVTAVVAGSWSAVREPLIDQLDVSSRPRQAATLALFGQTLVLVAAAIAGYQATRSGGARNGWASIFDPALLSPILLGLAAGQAAAWALRSAAWWLSRRSKVGRLPGFLTVRRLARRSDTVYGTRLVIAAAVVMAVTVNATAAVASWQDETTRLAVGGPQRFTLEAGGALAAYTATHSVDPDGRWLMAVVNAPEESEPYRRVFADTARWEEVVGDFLAGTDAGEVSDHVAQMSTGAVVEVATGDKVTVGFDTSSLRTVYRERLAISYVSETGVLESVDLAPKHRLRTPGTTRVTAALGDCSGGCVVNRLVFDGFRPRSADGALIVTSIDFGGVELLSDGAWREPVDDRHRGGVSQDERGLRIGLTDYGDGINLVAATARQRLAAVTTPGLQPDGPRSAPVAYSVDGGGHPITPVGTTRGLPFVGRQGMLLDLPRALAFSGSTIAAATSFVVARADTPAPVIADLEATGVVGQRRDFSSALDAAERRVDAQGVRLYALMSVFAALIAVIGLAASLAGQRDERRREAASLRLTGVPARAIGAAYRIEAIWLAGCAFAVVAVTGWVASRLTIGGLSLVPLSAYTPRLTSQPSAALLLLVAAGAGALVGLVTMLVNRGIARRSPPSLLRDGVAG